VILEFTQVPPCHHRWPDQWWLQWVWVCLQKSVDPLRHMIEEWSWEKLSLPWSQLIVCLCIWLAMLGGNHWC